MATMAHVPVRRIGGAILHMVLWCGAARVAAGQAPAAVPPPVDQQTADCAASTYASDVLVCGDAELRHSDGRLAGLVATAAQAGVADRGALLESATDWFRRRSLCAFSTEHRRCLAAAYRERTAVLELLVGTHGWARPLELACEQAAWRGQRLRTQEGLDGLVLVDEAGRTLGVAFSGGEGPAWRPFLRFESSGRELTVSWAGGTRRCHQTTALDAAPDDALRGHLAAIDALAAAARADHASGQLDRWAYRVVLGRLREHELAVYAEARLRTFAQPIDEHYWYRSRFKFPSITQQELDRIGDPAAVIAGP
jgi:uncharacterized protein